MPKRFSCPQDMLAREIEIALALTAPLTLRGTSSLCGGDRAAHAVAIAAMLTERAGKGLSGMSLTEEVRA